MTIRVRTEERLELARARENLWKKFREEKETPEMSEDEKDAWENRKKSIIDIEEEEKGLKWRSNGREIEKVIIRGKLNIRTQPGGREDPHEDARIKPDTDKEGGGRASQASLSRRW